MADPVEKKFARMDENSADRIRKLVENKVGCGNTMALYESELFSWLRYGLFCMAMFPGLQQNSSTSEAQCVVMGGDVEACPRFGMTTTGEPRCEHARLAQLLELQKYINEHLNHSSVGNFSVFDEEKK